MSMHAMPQHTRTDQVRHSSNNDILDTPELYSVPEVRDRRTRIDAAHVCTVSSARLT